MIESCGDLDLERLRVKARLEIGEKDELIPQYIKELKDAIKDETNLAVPPDNEFLIRFLRARKYNVERAAKMLKKFFVLRRNTDDMITLLKPSLHVDLYKSDAVTILKKRDPKGRHILLLRASQWDTSKWTLDDILAGIFLILDEATATIDTQYHGITLIADFKGFGWTHAKMVGPKRLQNIANLLQDSYPARFKEIHLIHHPTIFNMVYSVIKPFLKEKIRKRINFHAHDLSSLHNFISTEYLPTYLGGKLENDEFADVEIVKNVLGKDQYYSELLSYGYRS